MFNRLSLFGSDDSGAVSVDYVVLAAALVGLGLSVSNAVKIGTFEAVEEIVPIIENPVGCGEAAGGAGVGTCG